MDKNLLNEYDIDLSFYSEEWASQYASLYFSLELLVLEQKNKKYFIEEYLKLTKLLEEKKKELIPQNFFKIISNNSYHLITTESSNRNVFSTENFGTLEIGLYYKNYRIFSKNRLISSITAGENFSLNLGLSEIYDEICFTVNENNVINLYFLDYDTDKKNNPNKIAIQIFDQRK